MRRNAPGWEARESLARDGYTMVNKLLAKRLKAARQKLIARGLDAKMARRIIQQVIYKAIGS